MRQRSRLPIYDCLILVVDDIEWNRVLIGSLLTEAGFTRLAYAVDGQDALDKIAEERPELVILDIMMPGIDGFEVCQRLRADHAYADLPIVMQTALSGVSDRNRAFEVGTTDFVTKPLDRVEFLARVCIHLENRVMIRDLRGYRDRLEGEMMVARSLFDHLLPPPVTLSGVERATAVTVRPHMVRSSDLGGDLWGVQPLTGGRVAVYLLDMAGRGISAALNACRLHTLVQETAELAGHPAEFLAELNRQAAELLALGDHATMIHGVIDCSRSVFTYAAAGANPPLVMASGGGRVRECPAVAGVPLGLSARAEYEQQEVPFEAGAGLVLYSNAVLDSLAGVAVGTAGSMGAGDGAAGDVAALVRLVADNITDQGLEQGFAGVVRQLSGSAAGGGVADDLTLLWVERRQD